MSDSLNLESQTKRYSNSHGLGNELMVGMCQDEDMELFLEFDLPYKFGFYFPVYNLENNVINYKSYLKNKVQMVSKKVKKKNTRFI